MGYKSIINNSGILEEYSKKTFLSSLMIIGILFEKKLNFNNAMVNKSCE